MYLELFKLHELPFRLSPDPQFLYLSKQHARAKAYMESTIWFTDGFVVITGEIGAGKTTLIETFLRELQSDAIVAVINQTQLSPTAFLQTVLVQFGFAPFDMKKPEVIATLSQFLMEQHISGRKVLLIVDEAQNLSHRVLEEVRMLSGVETTKEKVLRIILAGQPELNEKLNSKELIQLSQRVRLRFHLTALTKAETSAYIDHRLEVAGSQGRRIFAEDTNATIYKYTGGVPRLINTLCDTCMMAAFGKNKDTVGIDEVQAAIRELQWVEFASGTNRMRAPNMEHEHMLPSVETGHVVGRILLAIEGKTVVERELKPGRLVIGRTPDNDLQIDSKFISRHHCQIVTQQDSCLIEDLNSTNGIFVQSKRVRRHNLNDGDVVQVGQHEIMYIDERSPRMRNAHDPVDAHGATGVIESPKIG
ncbi:MAG TPA: AAA family ATPase [Steroidobacteraceae bacterium]|jgi:type II secretory pathway predicted ATPase ExeA|nr:AAA family ATPase [Steroidobacteraceae bacterium]